MHATFVSQLQNLAPVYMNASTRSTRGRCSHAVVLICVSALCFGTMHAATSQQRHRGQRFERNCHDCPAGRSGSGILFFAYGVENRTFHYFAKQVVEAAHRVKLLSPEVRIAVATSAHYEGFKMFDHLITIREDHHFPGSNYENRSDGHKRQYLTRILYLSKTPFKVTLAVDTNIVACTPLERILQLLATSRFDLAVASIGAKSSLERDINAHNFAIAYKWSNKISEFFDEWFLHQVDAGVALNDQGTLRNAARLIRKRHKDFQFHVLNPALASAFASTNPGTGFYPRETRVISGLSAMIHGDPFQGDKLCAAFNHAGSKKRQIVSKDGSKMETVFTSEECGATLNLKQCRYTKLWHDTGESQLIPRTLPAMLE